jgi:hypothetical protein
VADLGRACEVVGLCMTDDSDVREILEDHGLLDSLVDALKTGSGSSFALQFLAGDISSEMSQHLPGLWHKDIGHFSDATRSRDLPSSRPEPTKGSKPFTPPSRRSAP